jgi:hypothetical protein
MKVWWVVAWDDYYPDSALHNVRSTHETKEEANKTADALRLEAYAPDHVDVINITEMLT